MVIWYSYEFIINLLWTCHGYLVNTFERIANLLCSSYKLPMQFLQNFREHFTSYLQSHTKLFPCLYELLTNFSKGLKTASKLFRIFLNFHRFSSNILWTSYKLLMNLKWTCYKILTDFPKVHYLKISLKFILSFYIKCALLWGIEQLCYMPFCS